MDRLLGQFPTLDGYVRSGLLRANAEQEIWIELGRSGYGRDEFVMCMYVGTIIPEQSQWEFSLASQTSSFYEIDEWNRFGFPLRWDGRYLVGDESDWIIMHTDFGLPMVARHLDLEAVRLDLIALHKD